MTELPRFLLIRLDGLGDALACVPALEGLRQAYPDATFGAVCSPANAQVFSPRVTVHVYDGAPVESSGSELRRAGYTHALVATEEVAGYELARASGARRRAGFWHRFEKPFKSIWQFAQLTDRVYRPAAWSSRPEAEVEALYRLALPFGAQPPPSRDISALRGWLAFDPPAAQERSGALGFQIAAKLTADGWGPAALAQLCAATLHASGLPVLTLLAASSDQGLASALLEHLDSDVRARAHLPPPTGVPLWLRAIDSLAALVTPDTGAAHAAGMLGVPVIDLFLSTRFDQLSRQWRPWAAPARCIVKPLLGPGVPARLGEQLGAQIVELRALDARP
ncbi:MAG TPA: glycosyltransferase family 9 protein [Magnetospirillaceae bacterium]|nr:glycosyltransferase family 9 protein [Magnetospirillaceae bacterium]